MTRLHYTDYTRDLMAMMLEARAEWARMRGIASPAGEVETDGMPDYQETVKTTLTEETNGTEEARKPSEETQAPGNQGPTTGQESGACGCCKGTGGATMTEYLTEDETSSVQRNRIQARAEQEVRFRELGQFDWADRTRDNTDTLIRGGEIRRRRGGPRDDE